MHPELKNRLRPVTIQVEEGQQIMSDSIPGHVKNGVIIPNAPLPEGAKVEIRLNEESAPRSEGLIPSSRLTAGQLRKMPREDRQAILSAAAEMAEQDYCFDKDLTGFEAFSEEDLDDDESDSR